MASTETTPSLAEFLPIITGTSKLRVWSFFGNRSLLYANYVKASADALGNVSITNVLNDIAALITIR